ncbi:hypothetical protein QE152_g19486 [Popillia japonica]|uniref:Uncharacterized protein n=1 Tax=Popillia japonica TaxID=7064 RepID=A0AAW1KP22_POPJA
MMSTKIFILVFLTAVLLIGTVCCQGSQKLKVTDLIQSVQKGIDTVIYIANLIFDLVKSAVSRYIIPKLSQYISL